MVFECQVALCSDTLKILLSYLIVESNAVAALAADKIVIVLFESVGKFKKARPNLFYDAYFEELFYRSVDSGVSNLPL